jgi:anti-sigma regulatory factor (Ser/Thr protein kinase)
VIRNLRVTLAANPEGVRTAALRVREMVAGASEPDIMACELAVAEAAANVVTHADSEDFTLVARTGHGRFSAAVCHRGPMSGRGTAEMPSADAESGRGLALIAACMQRTLHVHHAGESSFLMARRLSPTSLNQERSK